MRVGAYTENDTRNLLFPERGIRTVVSRSLMTVGTKLCLSTSFDLTTKPRPWVHGSSEFFPSRKWCNLTLLLWCYSNLSFVSPMAANQCWNCWAPYRPELFATLADLCRFYQGLYECSSPLQIRDPLREKTFFGFRPQEGQSWWIKTRQLKMPCPMFASPFLGFAPKLVWLRWSCYQNSEKPFCFKH